MTSLEELKDGDRVRVQGGRNFEKFHGGMEGTIITNNVENKNMNIQWDDVATAGPEPMSVAYRNLEYAPNRGGYRAGHAASAAATASQPGAKAPEAPKGPLVDTNGDYSTRQLVQLHSLQGAAELNGKLGRLRKFDVNAGRWEVDVREQGIKRLKEDCLGKPPKPEVPEGLGVEELKSRGNDCFKKVELEEAIAFYSAAIDLIEDDEADQKPPAECLEPKYVSVLHGNRAQVYISLCREVHGEDRCVSKEARMFAMRANMDSAKSMELDETNGKAYYRRGCAVLGMAPSASRAKEAIWNLEIALSGRASGGQETDLLEGVSVVLPNAMRHEVANLLEYAKRRLDACTEAAVPDVEAFQNCKQQ